MTKVRVPKAASSSRLRFNAIGDWRRTSNTRQPPKPLQTNLLSHAQQATHQAEVEAVRQEMVKGMSILRQFAV